MRTNGRLDLSSAAAGGEPVVLERSTRLSRSRLWQLQRAYFERAGVDAWRTGQVPHYITSNPFVAAAYARIVTGFLRDLEAARARAPGEPLTVIELGAGSGRFAYHFLQKLLAEPRIPLLRGAPIRYVITDVSPANLAFCRAHPQLRPFFDAGVLDLALFDAERDESMRLEISGQTLAPGAPRPLVAIANYVFDGLPQDAWLLQDGVLHESRVTLTAPAGTGDLAAPAFSDGLDVAFDHVPVEGTPDIDPDFAFLVTEYQQTIGEGALQLPTAALSCVRSLSRLAGGGFLLLSADKGHCREEELLRRAGPKIGRHGCISLDVDYHAIGRFLERLGGEALFPAHAPQHLCFGAFLLHAPGGGAETHAAFAAAADGFGPDDWFALKKGIEAGGERMALPHLLAALRAGGADAKLFMDVFDRLVALAPEASAPERRACFSLGRRLWELWYDIGEDRDLAFHLGVWMRELGYREEAIRYFERSRATRGTTGVTAFNLAYCHLGQQRAADALRCVEEAIAADPGLAEARALRTEIRAILRDEAA